MASHSSILAWRIPRTEEPGGLLSMGLHKSQTGLKRLSSSSDLAAATLGTGGQGRVPAGQGGEDRKWEKFMLRTITSEHA